MSAAEKLQRIRQTGVIAIMRARSSEQLLAAADAIQAGGVEVIEVTMNTPNALNIISEARRRYGSDVLFGAGTVLDTETARAALLAGADFIVMPTLNLNVLAMARRYSAPVIPGCFSPTEIMTAWEAGADMIKIFPANIGGPDLIKTLLGPLSQVELIPVGGVNLDTAADFIRSGAAALGVGSSLINDKLLAAGDVAEITRRAARFIELVQEARQA